MRAASVALAISVLAVIVLVNGSRASNAGANIVSALAAVAPSTAGQEIRSIAVEAATVPPAGGITTTVSESAEVDELVESIPFDVSFLGVYDVPAGRWLTYIPGAPASVNRAFVDNLEVGAVVWVQRDRLDEQPGLSWDVPDLLEAVRQPQSLVVPQPGRLTAGVAGTSSVASLIETQPFSVAAIFAFDSASQRYLTYFPGVIDLANTLREGTLDSSSIVWVMRGRSDTGSPGVASGTQLASVDSGRERGTPRDGQPPASAPTGAPSGATPTPTATPKASVTPTPTPSSTPSPSTERGTGELIRRVTYESNERAMTSQQGSNSQGLGTTTEAARMGSRAGYALLTPQDDRWSAGGYRAEWHGDDHTSGSGAERWHGISYYFPNDYNQGSNDTWNDRIIFQFADEGSPMFSLHLDVRTQELWVRRKLPERGSDGKPRFEELARWKFQTEQWYDIAFHAIWEKDGSGLFEVYVDGDRRVHYTGRTLGERSITYSKWGIYGQPARLFFDEVRTAEGPNRLADVSP